MKPKAKNKQSASPVLRVSGNDVQLVQLQDHDDYQGGRGLVINIAQARLSDANDNTIMTGQVIVRITPPMPAGSLAIVSRLLTPFSGFFVIVVRGNYQVVGRFAEVVADTVLATNIQPANRLRANKKFRIADFK